MTTSSHLAGAVEHLFDELTACRAWQADLEEEASRARRRLKSLAASAEHMIEVLPSRERPAMLERLARATGNPLLGQARGNARPTERTRAILAWLAELDPPEFHNADLRTFLTEMGETPSRNYIPTLMARWRKRGIVEDIGYGRFRVNRLHPELEG